MVAIRLNNIHKGSDRDFVFRREASLCHAPFSIRLVPFFFSLRQSYQAEEPRQTGQEQARIPLYFAHAYSPHERGSNENRNRVLRRFIPKDQPIEEITDDELIQIKWYLNSRPLKCLNWRTPIEIFLRNLRH